MRDFYFMHIKIYMVSSFKLNLSVTSFPESFRNGWTASDVAFIGRYRIL